MRFSCEKCSARYSIADERVRGRIVAVKCSKCGARITVDGKDLVAQAAHEDRTHMMSVSELEALRDAGRDVTTDRVKGATAPSERASVGDGWYVLINREQTGPLNGTEILEFVQAGRVGPRTYVWCEGMADWKRLNDVPELKALLPSAAPQGAGHPARGNGASTSEPARLRAEPEAMTPHEPLLAVETGAAAGGAKAEAISAPKASSEGLDKLLFDGELNDMPTITGRPVDIAGVLAATRAAKGLSPEGDSPAKGGRDAKGAAETAAPAPGDGAPAADPFASVPDSPSIAKPGEIGEQTKFFIRQAGVHRRNAPWKIALFVLSIIGLPVAVLYFLSTLNFVRLEITEVDPVTQQEIKTPIFSGEGIGGLRRMLLKEPPKRGPVRPVAASRPKVPVNRVDEDETLLEKKPVEAPTMSDDQKREMINLFKERETLGSAPTVRLEVEQPKLDGEVALTPEVLTESFGKNVKSIQDCTEQELKRNPNFRGGKVELTLTIGSSGVVTRVSTNRPDLEQSALGACLKDRAKRVVFPSFTGEAFDAVFPLVLTSTG